MLKKVQQQNIHSSGTFSLCLGSRTPTSRSASPVRDEPSEDKPASTDSSQAIKLQELSIDLQNKQRKAIKQLLEIFSTFSTDVQDWMDGWHHTIEERQKNATDLAANWKLFDTCVLAVQGTIEESKRSVEQLTNAKDEVRKLPKSELLRTQISLAQAEFVKSRNEFDALEKKRQDVGRKIRRCESNVSNDSSEIRTKELRKQSKKLEMKIESKKKDVDREQARFVKVQDQLCKDSAQDHVERCQSLETQLKQVIAALGIEADDSTKKPKASDAAENIKRQEKNVLHRSGKQSCESDSKDQDNSVRTHKKELDQKT